VNIRKIIENIKLVSTSLQKKSNIYEVKAKNVTKNLDEQDKIFIEESCFDGQMKPSVMENTHIVKIRNDYKFEVTKLTGLLKNIGRDWNFNSFFLTDCCNHNPVQVSGFYSFHNFNLDGVFKIPDQTLKNFLKNLEETYKPNPYHNSIHAADVMNSHLFLLNNSKLFEVCSNLDLMTSIVAALGHDAGHPAKNNRFLVITKDDLAVQYNDISVLEMLHTSKVFQIVMKPDCNIFSNLNHDQWTLARKMIVEMILATDMSKHFDLLGQFRGKYKTPESFSLENNDMKIEIFRLIIKAADIGHAAKDIELHERWCRLVVEEFYTQGDLEKQMGLTVSMYCDRETTDISKSQAGFIKNIVLPLFTAVNFVLESQDIETYCIEQLKINENYWIHRRKSIRGRSLIQNNEEYVNRLNNLVNTRSKERKPSLPDKYLS
jgi:cAMP-specific phosphodiesterase 4